MRGVDGFGDVVAIEVDDAGLYENPDTRGPCGAEVDPIPTDGIALRAFSDDRSTIFEMVHGDAGAIGRVVDELERDLVPGCGGHESVTNTGATQQVTAPAPLDTTGIGERSIGWTSSITSGGVTVHAALVIVIDGDEAALVQIIGVEPVGDDAVLTLARAAAARLGE